MKQNESSGSFEQVKSQCQCISHEKQSTKPNQISINNRDQLARSLHQSYSNNTKQSVIGRAVNKISYFLQAFWQEIIPVWIKGNPTVWVKDENNPYQITCNHKGPTILHGSLAYSLQICLQRQDIFIILVYNTQISLVKFLQIHEQKIKNYLILPIKNNQSKQLEFLSFKAKSTSQTILYLCRFNFANELIIFCQIDEGVCLNEFNNIFGMAEMSVKDYLDFEETALRKFRQEKGNDNQVFQ